MSMGYKQEMPPEGGYSAIKFERVKPQRIFKSWTLIGITAASMIYGHFHYTHRRRYYGKLQVERWDNILAVEPLMWAERDREFLRQLRMNREEERELMKNVPGWVVGTVWGHPVYESIEKNDFPGVNNVEYWAHRPMSDALEYYWPDTWA